MIYSAIGDDDGLREVSVPGTPLLVHLIHSGLSLFL